jgi:polar amino acid transport system permease protein
VVWPHLRLLLIGASVTAWVSVVSILAGLAIGVLVCAARLSASRTLRGLAVAWVSFFRGVPLLVLLLLIYNMLPVVGLVVPGIVAALVGLTLCTSAYQAETLRGGFVSVGTGLIEAARMTGMTGRQILLRIRLPIALRLVYPAVLNEAVMILKASSLVSVVGVGELTRAAQNLQAATYRPLEAYAMAGGIYLALNILLSAGGSGLGRMLGGARMRLAQ